MPEWKGHPWKPSETSMEREHQYCSSKYLYMEKSYLHIAPDSILLTYRLCCYYASAPLMHGKGIQLVNGLCLRLPSARLLRSDGRVQKERSIRDHSKNRRHSDAVIPACSLQYSLAFHSRSTPFLPFSHSCCVSLPILDVGAI